MTEPDLTLDDRYLRFAVAILTALAVVAVAGLYSRAEQAWARAVEIAELEAIPVLDAEP